MKKSIGGVACGLFVLCATVSSLALGPVQQSATTPVRLDREKMAGLN